MFFSRSDRYWYREYRRSVRRRRLAFLLAATLVVLIAAAAHHGRPHPGHRKHPATTPTSPRTTQTSRPKAPRPAAAAARPELTWADFHGIALPVSAQDGPRHTRGGLAWGFSDTRTGAALAAVNITVRTAAQWGPAIYRPTIRRQVTGPDAVSLLKGDTSEYAALRSAAHVPAGQPAGRGYATEAGYRFLAYTAAIATVDIVTEGPGSGSTTVLAVTRIQVIWQRGDWRVVAPPGGNWASSATAASSLARYTTFPGER